MAYAPKVAFQDPDALGAVFVSDEADFNVREAVTNSPHKDGTFVVSDPRVIARLDAYEALKRVAVPEEKTEEKKSSSGRKGQGGDS